VKILALDTATENCSVALWVDGQLSVREQLLERGHAEHLLPMIDELLVANAVSLRDLAAIAFGRGPGAFTGVRLAASVAQGLAFGAQLPVVPVSDLAALAERVLSENEGTCRVIVCTDARLGEVYWSCFERGDSGLAAAATPERVSRPEAVRLPEGWNGTGGAWVAAGSGFSAYPQLQGALGAAPDGIREGLLPRAREVARLAAPEVSSGRVLPAEAAIPVYLRDDVTQPSRERSLN
jgi:tRNA threonylcarbamoyladenosine biosynthesis protein TsaB